MIERYSAKNLIFRQCLNYNLTKPLKTKLCLRAQSTVYKIKFCELLKKQLTSP